MKFEFSLALKFFRLRRKSLARFTALVAIVGIAAGVGSLITAQALARGFQTEITDKILANTPHILIYKEDGEDIADWQKLSAELSATENVAAIAPTSYENAILVSGNATSYAVLRINEQKSFPENQASAPFAVAIGRELAEKAALQIGDEAEIVLPVNQNQIAPKTAKVSIAEIFTTGIYDYDSTWIYISLENLAKLRQISAAAPKALSVSLTDVFKAAETSRRLRAKLPQGFQIIDWQKANQPLFAALSLERKLVLAIILLIIFIAALNITTTLALIVNERRADIAVLRTCGAKTGSLLRIFLLEGLFLGMTGIFFGLFFGISACFLGNHFKIIRLPAEVYALDFVPLNLNSTDILTVAVGAFLLILLSSIVPAAHAARLKPMENLRFR